MNHDGVEAHKHRIEYRCPLASRKYGCSCKDACFRTKSHRQRALWIPTASKYFEGGSLVRSMLELTLQRVNRITGILDPDAEKIYPVITISINRDDFDKLYEKTGFAHC